MTKRCNLATRMRASLVGIQERTMIYSYMLWVVVLAVILLREEKRSGLIGSSDTLRDTKSGI